MLKSYLCSGLVPLFAAAALLTSSPGIAQQSGQSNQKDQTQSQNRQSQQNPNRSDQSQMEKGSGKTENRQTGQSGVGNQSSQPGQTNQTAVLVVIPVEFQRVRAGQLIGKNIYGSRGNEIGEIEDIVLRTDGKAVAAVADIGGFLGMGEKQVTIPLNDLSMQGDRIVAQNLTEQSADRLELYDRNGWRPFDRDRMLGDNR